jgi:hypothetical protein
MGRASSAKKVKRAAQAGGAKSSRNLVWPLALGAIVVLGSVLIFLSRPKPSEAQPPVLGDHWHVAYGIYACDEFVPPLADARADASGIHTHQDGLIHIHPFSTRYTGEGANLEAFARQVGLELGDDGFQLPGGEAFQNGDDCGGEPGVVQVKVWTGVDDPEGRLLEGDVTQFAPPDSSLVTIAFVPEGADIPRPPSAGTVPGDVAGGAPVGGGPLPAGEAPDPSATTPGAEGADGEGADGEESGEGEEAPEGEVPPEGDGTATTVP